MKAATINAALIRVGFDHERLLKAAFLPEKKNEAGLG
jgi:hypothetical protein